MACRTILVLKDNLSKKPAVLNCLGRDNDCMRRSPFINKLFVTVTVAAA
jgi:hypothetical protein